MIWTYRGEDILFFQGVVCSGMHSGNSWEALVICEDAIVFSLSGKYCIYLFQYFKTKLTFLIPLASPLYFLLARGGSLFPASWTFNYKDKSISYFHQLPLSWNITWQYLLPFVVVEIINPRAFDKKWVKEEESDQYWKNWGLRRIAYWLGHREMRDQLNARKMWVSGEGTQIVSVRYEDRYGNRGFKSILEVRRWRIQAKSWHLPSCKGLSLSGGRGSPSEGARRLQTFLALCTCLVSKQEEFLHVLPGSSDTAPHGVETSIYTSPSVWHRNPGSSCFLALPK